MSFGESEQELKGMVTDILRARKEFVAVTEITDKTERARHLVPLLTSQYHRVGGGALDELAKCGRDGLPIYRDVLNDENWLHFHPFMVEMMVNAAGEEVGPELNSRLQLEVAYWKKRAPDLRKGWWGDSDVPDHKALQDQYMVVFRIIEAFEKIRYQPSIPEVKEFLDLWRSSPILNDKSGLDRIVEEGDKLLRELGADQP
jgi:hypothetical protein